MNAASQMLVFALIVLILFSGLFSAVETAYSSASRIRLKAMENDGDSGAGRVLKVLDNYDRFLTSVLIGNNIVNILSATLGTILFTRWLGETEGPTVSTIVITLVVLLFGEITPKTFAKQSPERFAIRTLSFVRFIMVLFRPLGLVFQGWQYLTSKLFKVENKDPDISDELITMVIDKNNMHDFDTSLFFRFLFKACIAVSLLSKTFDIVMAVFDVGSHVVTQAAASISGSTSLDVQATLTSMFNSQIDSMGIGELIGLGMETMIISLCMKIMSVLITVILYGRMIEIYLYVSVAPIPAATVTNREWGTVGTNYLKGLIALAFQGFFIMVCVAIYAVLVASVAVASNLHSALWSVAAYTVILCFSLFKTGSLSKSIFNAH